MFCTRLLPAVLLLAFAAAIPCHADMINHGNMDSPRIFYEDVTEVSFESNFPLYGLPSLNGDQLKFSDPDFAATVGADSIDFIDGRLITTVNAKNGRSITSFEVSESGSWETSGSVVDVYAGGLGFATADGDLYSNMFEFSTVAIGAGDWSGSFMIEFDQPVSSFQLVLDNQLFARAGAGSTAAITKGDVTITVNTVPEPTAAIILAIGGIGCLVRRR